MMSSPNHTRVCFCLNYKWNSSSRALRDHRSLVGGGLFEPESSQDGQNH